METVNTLSKRIRDKIPDTGVSRHQGVVQEVNPDNTVDITLDGGVQIYFNIRHLRSYVPNIDDVVEVLIDDADAMVIGSIGESIGGIPPGLICMWSGSIAEIPDGWTLCDGSFDSPDLRDRFIVGAGGGYAEGTTGGADSVTLTESQMPQHSHGDGSLSTSNDGHSHTVSGNTGEFGSHYHTSGNLTTNNTGYHTHNYSRLSSSGGSVVLDSNAASNISSGTDNTGGDGNHSHNITGNTTNSGDHYHNIHGNTDGDTHGHSVSGTTNSAGGGTSHENRPPYYALAFIMKL